MDRTGGPGRQSSAYVLAQLIRSCYTLVVDARVINARIATITVAATSTAVWPDAGTIWANTWEEAVSRSIAGPSRTARCANVDLATAIAVHAGSSSADQTRVLTAVSLNWLWKAILAVAIGTRPASGCCTAR